MEKERMDVNMNICSAQKRVIFEMEGLSRMMETYLTIASRNVALKPKTFSLKELPPHILFDYLIPKGIHTIDYQNNREKYIAWMTIPLLSKQLADLYRNKSPQGYVRFKITFAVDFDGEKKTINLKYIEMKFVESIDFDPPLSLDHIIRDMVEDIEGSLHDVAINNENNAIYAYSFPSFRAVLGLLHANLLEKIKEE